MKIKLEIDINEIFTQHELRNFILEQLYAVMRQEVQHLMGKPPLSELYPCHKCGRRGDSTFRVVDLDPDPRNPNHPQRFRHAYGVCPKVPDVEP